MANVKSRITALEKMLAPEVPEETDFERIQRENTERYHQRCDEYVGQVEQIIGVMDEPYASMVYNELKVLDENWWSSPMCMQEDCLRGERTPLTTAVLTFANALQRGKDFPCQFPKSMCEFFIARGHEVFSPVRAVWGQSVPRTTWLMGSVACDECNYPLPSRDVGYYKVEELRDEPGPSYELPFKRCPCCDGQISWGKELRRPITQGK